ncbi:LysR family transcriptional regulator [Streptomyces sp. Wh19]|uniref:LysR family transcriptional regulator n=1 Tax=Streptomyces sp. Wh19 TaxID=3076629 RepID=UPI002958D587|nr:LysR family transcriptional regulator [Streptomyces sp. Wh19]MDV9197893.1 LysR family transcriptional regulator [Streptomyces sp. Wh19]
MFEIDALRLLVAVAETGSFTKAAVRLNYTQSAVSRRIAALEQRAGGPLLERLPRGVRLNPVGRVLHRHALEVLDRMTRAERELAVLAAKDASLTVTDRTLQAWLEGKRRPSKANLERIDAAYRTVRRRNLARHLLARLNREGRGTRVEIYPLNQSQVARPLRRVVEYRTMNVRRWDRIVEAWAAGDLQGLDDEWTTDVLPDLGSQWGQYEYVTNIGFAA